MRKIKLYVFLSILLISKSPIRGQELNVQETLAYINKQLNDEYNKFSYGEDDFFLKLGVDWTSYKYEVKIENGSLKFLKYFFRDYYKAGTRLRVTQELSSSLKDLSSSILSHCNYTKYFSFLIIKSNSSLPIQNNSLTKKTIKYGVEGQELERITEKLSGLRFTIEFSNKNLVCDKLHNAFTHLLNIAINDSVYNTEEILVDNDPFVNPIKRDTIVANGISVPNSNSIPMTKTGGVYQIPIIINGVLKLDFIFDAGAADVSISPDVALTLIKTGTVTDKDFTGTETYKFADGSTAKSKIFIIKEIQIGNKKIYNVKASISNSINAPLLLGQSVINKFGKVSIDYNKGAIIFEE